MTKEIPVAKGSITMNIGPDVTLGMAEAVLKKLGYKISNAELHETPFGSYREWYVVTIRLDSEEEMLKAHDDLEKYLKKVEGTF